MRERALAAGINFRYIGETSIGIALDETCDTTDVSNIVAVFASSRRRTGARRWTRPPSPTASANPYPAPLRRTSAYLTHPVFNKHHSETEMMRYIRSLEAKDIGLETSMIPLGSCTMKLNAAAEMLPVTWPEFSKLHPFAPRRSGGGLLPHLPRARSGAL